MEWFEAIILGLVQGLTEFLPVSSSGHLVIGREILGVEESGDLVFEVAVHAATVLSTIVVFRHQIWNLLKGLFRFKYNDETDYILKICVSMIPVFIIGVFFKSFVEGLFELGNVYVRMDDIERAMYYLQRCYEKSKEIDDKVMQGKCVTFMASCSGFVFNLPKARHYYGLQKKLPHENEGMKQF